MRERTFELYRGSKVLVTGGASFIGSHLTECLVAAGAKITVVDNFSTGRIENLDAVRDRITLIEDDLLDIRVCEKSVAGQDIVFHLAAAHGGRGYLASHPADCASNMVLDGLVFRSSRLAGVDRVCYASSACVYPVDQQTCQKARPLNEEMAGLDIPGSAFSDTEYGWAKLMGEMVLRAALRQYGLKGVSCRIFTAYGPRENDTHAVIALILRSLRREEPFVIWGDGTQRRNFTYIDDIVQGLMLACASITDGSAINLGTTRGYSILETCEMIWQITGFRPARIEFQTEKPVGVHTRVADGDRAKRLLNWEATTALKEGLQRTVDWLKV